MSPPQTMFRSIVRRAVLVIGAVGALACALAGCTDPLERERPATLTEGCTLSNCHAEIEVIHYGGPPLSCVDCHLGDPTATTKEGGHVTVDVSFNRATPGERFLNKPPMDELDALPDDVVQFLNPSDYRVVQRTCGTSVLAGGSCHTTISENSVLLNRSTLAGTLAGGGFIAGLWGKDARYGVTAVQDPLVPEELSKDYVARLSRLPDEPPSDVTDPVARAFFPVLEQLCMGCHVNRPGPRVPGLYTASGCAACHMLTAEDSRAQTVDPTQDREELGHVATHRFTNLIPDTQCARCHISHLGRSLLAQGIRERSEPDGDEAIGGHNRGIEDPERAVPWAEENYIRHNGRLEIYGKPYPFYIEDEDGLDGLDQTPPDVHTKAGLACIDCHNMFESHGDRHMDMRMDSELDVRCESCHGRPGEWPELRSERGFAFTLAGTAVGTSGENRAVFDTGLTGEVRLLGKFSGARHPVTQITENADPNARRFNKRTRTGCELHSGTAESRRALRAAVNEMAESDPAGVPIAFPGLSAGFRFDPDEDVGEGRTECFTCHNRWTVNCYGCHMVRDDRQSYVSQRDGVVRQGAVTSYGMSVVADALALGFNSRGRISPLVGTSIFFTHIDEDGERVIDAQPLTTHEGLSGDGNVHNPVHHHTTRWRPRDCDGCHPSETDSHNDEALLRVVGLGTERFPFTDGSGRVHQLDRLITADVDGDGVDDDPAEVGLPTAVRSVTRLVGTTHALQAGLPAGTPEPGPLDLTTVNRVLGTRVLPQRPGEGGGPQFGGP